MRRPAKIPAWWLYAAQLRATEPDLSLEDLASRVSARYGVHRTPGMVTRSLLLLRQRQAQQRASDP